jgi:hypothetical protein
MADAGPVVKRLLERPELRSLRLDFHPALATGAATLLHGLLAREGSARDARTVRPA